MSINLIAISINSSSGCSYITHIIFAASIAEPPPTAIMQSGLNAFISFAPSFADAKSGSGATLKNVSCVICISSNLSVTTFVYPFSYKNVSVTINTLFLFITFFNSSRATGKQPLFIYTFSGALNQSIFSLLSATVFIFNKCFIPTFSETEFPPHVPHPNVSDGANLKLYKSPIPPCDAGVFIITLHVFILL